MNLQFVPAHEEHSIDGGGYSFEDGWYRETPEAAFCSELTAVVVLSAGASSRGPDEAELVARLLEEYSRSVNETMRLDPRSILRAARLRVHQANS